MQVGKISSKHFNAVAQAFVELCRRSPNGAAVVGNMYQEVIIEVVLEGCARVFR